MADNTLSIVDIYNLMSNQKILMTYLGDITPDITNALLKSIKDDTNQGTDEEVIVKKKVYKIIVECLENICRHTEITDQRPFRPSLFVLGKHDNHYHIISGNYIIKTQADSIKAILDQLSGLDADGVKQKYREVLAEGKLTQKGGAGLGMLDIVQKSGNKIEYDFLPADEGTFFFMIKAQVAAGKL